MELRKLKDLHKLEGNPRVIYDQDFERLCESIKNLPEYFPARPIILSNRTGKLVIIGGNQRYEAAKKLGLKEVPTYLIEGLSEEKEREITIRDNVNNGRWDYDLLANKWSNEPLKDWGVEVWEKVDEGDIVELDKIVTTYNINIKCDSPDELEELKYKLGITANSIHSSMLIGLLA